MIVCGKEFSSTDIAIIKDIIADNQQISRAQLSQQVCKALNWRSDNEILKDMSCPVALLRMHHQGVINLPQVHQQPCFKDKMGHDLEALKSALRTDARYIGLLGSKRKKALLFKTLANEGFSQNDINRIITPVGLAIGSVTPEEIAVSIMAQIIQVRRQDGSSDIGSSSCSRLSEKDGSDKTASSVR